MKETLPLRHIRRYCCKEHRHRLQSACLHIYTWSIGTSPNPLLRTTTEGLEANKWGCLVVNEETLETTKNNVYAGGDAVTGAATVILAMGAGKQAAENIDKKLRG